MKSIKTRLTNCNDSDDILPIANIRDNDDITNPFREILSLKALDYMLDKAIPLTEE